MYGSIPIAGYNSEQSDSVATRQAHSGHCGRWDPTFVRVIKDLIIAPGLAVGSGVDRVIDARYMAFVWEQLPTCSSSTIYDSIPPASQTPRHSNNFP